MFTIKGKNSNKEVHRQITYFRVIAPTTKFLYGIQNSSKPTKLTHTERMVNICPLI